MITFFGNQTLGPQSCADVENWSASLVSWGMPLVTVSINRGATESITPPENSAHIAFALLFFGGGAYVCLVSFVEWLYTVRLSAHYKGLYSEVVSDADFHLIRDFRRSGQLVWVVRDCVAFVVHYSDYGLLCGRENQYAGRLCSVNCTPGSIINTSRNTIDCVRDN